MSASIVSINITRRFKRPFIDLVSLEASLLALPATRLSDVRSPQHLERCARERLISEGVILKGHQTVIAALLQARKDELVRDYSECDATFDLLFSFKQNGRPSKYSSLRDFLVFTQFVIFRSFARAGQTIMTPREAHRETAKAFNLVCGTQIARRNVFSGEQARRACERTVARFGVLERFGWPPSLEMAWPLGVSALVLEAVTADSGISQEQRAKIMADAANLVCLCRTLDVIDRLDRLQEGGRPRRKVLSPGVSAQRRCDLQRKSSIRCCE
jgi:hypothetical protein